mmetsp:Transcript_29257/g.97157  ORF Transcript_29257/g.97157 Transcript_29257/m.97157 type:complete len:1083 (-) Transcript_29257:73-3321(-)
MTADGRHAASHAGLESEAIRITWWGEQSAEEVPSGCEGGPKFGVQPITYGISTSVCVGVPVGSATEHIQSELRPFASGLGAADCIGRQLTPTALGPVSPRRLSKRKLVSLALALEDPESAAFESGGGRVEMLRFRGYFCACSATALVIAAAAVLLWSDMGCGADCLECLQSLHGHAPFAAAAALGIVSVLYLLDFFSPPHLPGTYLALFQEDRFVGRPLFAVAGLLLLAACYLYANTYPTVPLALTIFISPLSLLLVRHVTMPEERFIRARSPSNVMQSALQDRVAMLRRLTGEEKNQKDFYRAAMCAFLLTGLLCLGVWVPWAVGTDGAFRARMRATSSHDERDLVFVRWVAPAVVGFSNMIFASFAGLRLALNEVYTGTDRVKNGLLAGTSGSALNDELMHHRMAALQDHFAESDVSSAEQQRLTKNSMEKLSEAQDRARRYLVQHIAYMRQLSNIIKAVGCAFVLLIGALYVAFQLFAADGHIAQMVQGMLGALFLTFVTFVCVAFHRLWSSMRVWLQDLPLWASAHVACSSPWCRALLLLLLLPAVPPLLLLSAANQRLRRCRGLAEPTGQGADEVGGLPGSKRGILTQRFQSMVDSVAAWEWVAVVRCCYFVGLGLVMWNLVPLALNVLLAWMSSLMRDLSFMLILVCTFMAGMVLFMLPPVPGPPIYLFGGFVISDSCPWGFWSGSIICIALCFVLKLSACALQQQVIGRYLGDRDAVRRAIGVHRPFIRAIESVLRQPGLSLGKCMILCGGPDWPTSVLAGVLKVSLLQCELGTCPVILSLVPLTLTGSFYLKREDSETWTRAGNLMFTLTVMTSMMFWAGMGWAIQHEFEKNHDALHAPRQEYVDLDWLDHRAAVVAKRCNTTWGALPWAVRVPFVGGALGLVVVSHMFFWRFAKCFGGFKVTDDFSDLVWYGQDALVTPLGAIGLALASLSCLGLVIFLAWNRQFQRGPVEEAARDLDATEAAWKAARLELAELARSCTEGAGAAPEACGVGVQTKEQEWIRSVSVEFADILAETGGWFPDSPRAAEVRGSPGSPEFSRVRGTKLDAQDRGSRSQLLCSCLPGLLLPFSFSAR